MSIQRGEEPPLNFARSYDLENRRQIMQLIAFDAKVAGKGSAFDRTRCFVPDVVGGPIAGQGSDSEGARSRVPKFS